MLVYLLQLLVGGNQSLAWYDGMAKFYVGTRRAEVAFLKYKLGCGIIEADSR